MGPMGSPQFTDLPPEVILKIFQNASDFTTVNALVRTSSIFHCIWLLNANTICPAVLPNAIECYQDARCLVEVQEQAEALANPSVCRRRSRRGKVIVLVRRYLENSALVGRFYKNHIPPVIESYEVIKSTVPPLLERSRFIKTLYHLKTLAIMHEVSGTSCSVLSNLDKPALVDISDFAIWLYRKSPLERRRELGLEKLVMGSYWLQNWLDHVLRTTQVRLSCVESPRIAVIM